MEKAVLLGIMGFAVGTSAQSLLELSWFHILYTGFIAAIFIVVFIWKHLPLYALAASLIFGCMLGMVRTELVPNTTPPEFTKLVGTQVTFEGVVIADPDRRETGQRLTVEIREGDATTKALVVAPSYPAVWYGETIRASGTLVEPEPFATDGGRMFAYDSFLAKDGIFVLLEDASVEVIGEREGIVRNIRGALSDLKFEGITALSVALPEPQASLASGLILGGKQGLGTELLDDFIRSGLVHIVVLSGYNVMIVAQFVLALFAAFAGRWRAYATVVTIALFVLAAGAGPASIRAGIMAGIAVYARTTGRSYDAFRGLLAAALCMLLWNPLTLPYDPGFQLSFIATLGLIFGAPITERWLGCIKNAFIREIASVTLAAQIAVLPLLLFQNGLFSVVALPANLLVLPVVPFTMLASFVAMLAGTFVPFAPPVIGYPAHLLLSYVIAVVEFASGLPLAAITVPAFPFSLVMIAYLALFVCVRRALMISAKRTR